MNLAHVEPHLVDDFDRFVRELRQHTPVPLLSMHVVGSALTVDFDPETSDINSVCVFREISTALLDFLVTLGKKYRGRRIGAPVLMTPEYIQRSLDVFPIEFLNFQVIHLTVTGDDIFQTIVLRDRDLRLQCEREIKSKVLWLHQSYLQALGDSGLLAGQLAKSISGYFPLLRALLRLCGLKIPLSNQEVLTSLKKIVSQDTSIFETIYDLKRGRNHLSRQELATCFDRYYRATSELALFIDRLDRE
ncbi:hypothetical protein [Desulfolithobacter sp.]